MTMKGKKPDFRVYVSRPGEEGKNFYNEVGAAWKVKSDGISIKLFAAPLDGNLVMFPYSDDNGHP